MHLLPIDYRQASGLRHDSREVRAGSQNFLFMCFFLSSLRSRRGPAILRGSFGGTVISQEAVSCLVPATSGCIQLVCSSR
jgi:hypothetical protein